MGRVLKTLLATSVCALACLPVWATVEVDGMGLDDSVQVAGKHLKLNGAGVSRRLVFRVYAMGLYLPDYRGTLQDVIATEGPRRVVITMLRDLNGVDFLQAMADYVASEGTSLQAIVATGMLQLGHSIASHAPGLRSGDVLTLDWVPGTGTVVELNKRAVSTPPLRDIAIYNALLNIWLGERPADPSLKAKLLGRPQLFKTSLNY